MARKVFISSDMSVDERVAVDHITPLSKGGGSNERHRAKCNRVEGST